MKTPKFQQHHYVAVAELLASVKPAFLPHTDDDSRERLIAQIKMAQWARAVAAFDSLFKGDNVKYKSAKFLAAAGVDGPMSPSLLALNAAHAARASFEVRAK